MHFDPNYRNREDFHILTDTELEYSRKYLVWANKTLNRNVPKFELNTYKLLARNYYQIRDSNMVYAVSALINNKVDGGSAWAVQMFINSNMDPKVYLFDQNGRGWLSYEKDTDSWISIEKPPRPHGRYTGIGNRIEKLQDSGKEAIIGLYSQDS